MCRGCRGGGVLCRRLLEGAWWMWRCGSVICDPCSGEINANPLARVHHSAASLQSSPRAPHITEMRGVYSGVSLWYTFLMLDIAFILENRDIVRQAAANKNKEPVDFDCIESLYKRRNELLRMVDTINRERKEAAGSRDTERGVALKQKLAETEDALRVVVKDLTALIAAIPNIPSPDTPVGRDEDDNVVLRSWGEKPEFNFQPKAHWDIGKERGIIDAERAAKVSGARFAFLKGDIVRLQFAIIQWTLSVVTSERVVAEVIAENNLSVSSKPFTPVLPPVMIAPEMLFGMARLDPKEDKYFIEKDNLFLVGSAEHTLGTMHAGETFQESEMPLRYIGYSTAFRREAGSYGKDTKGILRQHQFDKMEFETFSVGERSKEEQDFLVAMQEYVMRQLGLPYQVVAVCTGDMGGPDIRQIDIETWMPGQGKYRETHSADFMGEYQSRRLGIKIKRESGEKEFAHMNDATVFALGRTLIALIENNQREDGSIAIPEVLWPYMEGAREI